MSPALAALKYLQPGWFAVVMGLGGLSLAWHKAVPLIGEPAGQIAWAVGLLAALVFALLALATLLRGWRHADAWAEDRRHPVRHTFIASLPVSAILLATVAVVLQGPSMAALWLWGTGALALLGVTLWVLARWWHGNRPAGLKEGVDQPHGLVWDSVTPALFVPIVGNVLVPLAGVPLGQLEWSAAQFGIGLLFWPVVMALIVVRIALQGLWPERLLPTAYILLAPPAVVGSSALQLGAPALMVWALWGMAVFSLLWLATLTRRIAALPFGMTHWAMSFPLTAVAALTLRLASPGSPLAVPGLALLALCTVVILALLAGTLRGLREGSLLVPEPAANVLPVAGDGHGAGLRKPPL